MAFKSSQPPMEAENSDVLPPDRLEDILNCIMTFTYGPDSPIIVPSLPRIQKKGRKTRRDGPERRQGRD